MIRGLIYSVISGLSFAFLPILGKLAYAEGMDVQLILQSRFTIASLMLFVWFWFTDREVLRFNWRTLGKAAILGILFYPLQSWFFMRAVESIPASTPTLILYFYPVAVTLLCTAFFGEKPSRTTVLSLIIVTLGCCLVFYDAFLASLNTTGLLFALGAMVVFSAYLVAVQVLMKGEHALRLTFYVICCAGVVWCVASGGPGGYLELSAKGLVVVFGLGLITGVFAVTFLYKAIDLIGSPMTSIFSTIEPAAAVILAWIILGEPLAWLNVAGMVLIVAGIVWPNMKLLRTMHGAGKGEVA